MAALGQFARYFATSNNQADKEIPHPLATSINNGDLVVEYDNRHEERFTRDNNIEEDEEELVVDSKGNIISDKKKKKRKKVVVIVRTRIAMK